jgi:hypothetical protein
MSLCTSVSGIICRLPRCAIKICIIQQDTAQKICAPMFIRSSLCLLVKNFSPSKLSSVSPRGCFFSSERMHKSRRAPHALFPHSSLCVIMLEEKRALNKNMDTFSLCCSAEHVLTLCFVFSYVANFAAATETL